MPVKTDREYRNLANIQADEADYIVTGQFTTYDSPYMLYSFDDYGNRN